MCSTAAPRSETLGWQQAIAVHQLKGQADPLEVPYRWARVPLPPMLEGRSDGAYLVAADSNHQHWGLPPHRIFVRKGWHDLRSFLLEARDEGRACSSWRASRWAGCGHCGRHQRVAGRTTNPPARPQNTLRIEVSVLSMAAPTYVQAVWSILDPPEHPSHSRCVLGACCSGAQSRLWGLQRCHSPPASHTASDSAAGMAQRRPLQARPSKRSCVPRLETLASN